MANKLARYQSMRDFSRTAEPSGRAKVKPAAHLRYVIQKHAATRLHYDFRLELDGVFKSWAVTKGPSLDPHERRLAVEVEDHPLDYGDFEGTIPKDQYGGGSVMLWDRGYWAPEPGTDPHQGLEKGDLKIVLEGERLHGGFVLVRMKADRNGYFYVANRTDGKIISAKTFVPVTWSKGIDLKTGRHQEDPDKRPRNGFTAKDICPNLLGGKKIDLSLRQPGSAIKPFTYAAALDGAWSSRSGQSLLKSLPSSSPSEPAAAR